MSLSDELKTIADTVETNGGWRIAALKIHAAIERIELLEAALMELANKCHGELGCPGYKLAYDLALCPPKENSSEEAK